MRTAPERSHCCGGLLAAAALFAASNAQGQSAPEWQTSLVLYAQMANLSGETAIGPLSADIDLSFDELVDHLDAAGMMALRSEQERFALTLNAFYTGLDSDTTNAAGNLRAAVDLTQTLIELTGSWRLNESFELFAGGRYQDLDAKVTVTTAGSSSAADRDESWTDLIVGARHVWPFATAWKLILRADIGGFGIESDFTWSAFAAADWSVSRNFGVVFGYRSLGTDFETGSGASRFKYDTLISGPVIGLRFDF